MTSCPGPIKIPEKVSFSIHGVFFTASKFVVTFKARHSIKTCFLDVRDIKWSEHYNIVASYPPEQGRPRRTDGMGGKRWSWSHRYWKG